jgi:chemotaxis family two-component system response regulator PixH
MQQIFLVHDQQELPASRKTNLEQAGFEVVLMKSGEEALKALMVKKPALVLMDILLDGKNGFEVCRAIRERAAPGEVPVILCSHIYRSRIYRDEATAAGAQRFLLQPMKVEELIAHVVDLAGSRAKAR